MVGLANLLAETGLQLLALGWMIRIVEYGRSRGFYNAGRNAALPFHARRMYNSAAAYLVLGSVMLVLQVGLSVAWARQWREDEGEAVIAKEEKAMMKSPWRFVLMVWKLLILMIPFIMFLVSLLFWSGFVYLAQDR
jgi:hypothetical protein